MLVSAYGFRGKYHLDVHGTPYLSKYVGKRIHMFLDLPSTRLCDTLFSVYFWHFSLDDSTTPYSSKYVGKRIFYFWKYPLDVAVTPYFAKYVGKHIHICFKIRAFGKSYQPRLGGRSNFAEALFKCAEGCMLGGVVLISFGRQFGNILRLFWFHIGQPRREHKVPRRGGRKWYRHNIKMLSKRLQT